MAQKKIPPIEKVMLEALKKIETFISRSTTKKDKAIGYARKGFIYFLHQKSFMWLSKSAKTYPTTEGAILLGKALCFAGKYDEARKAFTQALNIQPDHPQAHLGMVRSYYRYKPKTDRKAHVKKIKHHIKLALQGHPEYEYLDNFTHVVIVALSVYKFRNIAQDPEFCHELIKYIQKIASRNKSNGLHNHTWSYFECGMMYEKLNEFNNALAMYDKAIYLEPQFYSAYEYRAHFFKRTEKKQKALVNYQIAEYLTRGVVGHESAHKRLVKKVNDLLAK